MLFLLLSDTTLHQHTLPKDPQCVTGQECAGRNGQTTHGQRGNQEHSGAALVGQRSSTLGVSSPAETESSLEVRGEEQGSEDILSFQQFWEM